MCKDTHDADDVLQDTLLSIATHLPEFEGRSSLVSWVFALTRNACARRRRGLKNRPPVSEDAAPERPRRRRRARAVGGRGEEPAAPRARGPTSLVEAAARGGRAVAVADVSG